ncbi:MAG TPA: acyl carrier protein [Terriglobia bacterium]|nr:acyl carrier protein [Terriglobia bacterium]
MANDAGYPLPDGRSPHPEGHPPSAAAIEAWLVFYISEMLRVEPASIDVRRPFTYFGLSSAEGVILTGDLEKWLGGRRLSATLAWDFPTIEAVARHLAAGESAEGATSGAIGAFGNEEVEKMLSEIEQLPEDQVPRSPDGALLRTAKLSDKTPSPTALRSPLSPKGEREKLF